MFGREPKRNPTSSLPTSPEVGNLGHGPVMGNLCFPRSMPTRISSSSLFLTGPTWSTAASVFLVQSLRSRAPNGPDKQVVTNFFALMTRLLHLDLLSWRFHTVSGARRTIEFQTWKPTTCVGYVEFSTLTRPGLTARACRPC